MWPVHKNKGVQLSYGNDISGLFNGPLDSSALWTFPKQRRYPLKQLNIIPSTFRVISKPDSKTDPWEEPSNAKILERQSTASSINEKPSIVDDDVLEEEEKVVEMKLMNTSSKRMFDPTVSEVAEVIKVNTHRKNKKRYVLLSRAATDRSILVATILDPKHQDFRLGSPNVTFTTALKVEGEIKQIVKTVQLTHFGDDQYGDSLILIRTADAVHHLRISITNENHLELHKVGKLRKEELADQPFAYCSLNPYDDYQFAAVDVLGNFGVWKGHKHGINSTIERLDLSESTFNDPLELSDFKQVHWGSHLSSLLLISRSQLIKYDYDSGIMSNLITAGGWSKLLDLKRAPGSEQYCFLLTTMELILVDLSSDEFNRVLSWRHFLNEADTSLRLALLPVLSSSFENEIAGYSCLITSSRSNFTYCIEINIYEDVPAVINDPYYLNLSPKNAQINIAILNDPKQNDIYPVFQVAPDGELSTAVIEMTTELKKRRVVDYVRPKYRKSCVSLIEKKSIDFIYKNMLTSFLDALRDQDSKVEESVIEHYAENLGKSISEMIASTENKVKYFNLNEVVLAPSYIMSIDELESMLRQLREHFSDFGVSSSHSKSRVFGDMGQLSIPLNNEDSIFEEFYDFFSQFRFEADVRILILAKIICMDLGLGLLTFHKKGVDDVVKDTNELKKQLPSELLEIVNKWDIESDGEIEPEDTQSQTQDSLSGHLSAPTISVSSQSSSKKSPHRKRRRDKDILLSRKEAKLHNHMHHTQPELFTGADLLDSQSQTTQSQSQSQDVYQSQVPQIGGSQIERGRHGGHSAADKKLKKKKKKRSGFA